MASPAGRRTSLRLDLSQSSPLDSPPSIAALFLIRFDIKKGYVISWKNSSPGVDLEDAIEYKSLPSGLHNVREDLVYFIHDQYAGISAFVNHPAAEAERNALMLAVGVLVPLSFGRLGKSWRHAVGLKELAKKCADDVTNTQPLDDYWERHHVRENDYRNHDSPPESPAILRTKSTGARWSGSISETTGWEATRPVLAPFHPAISLPDFVQSFGPLIFPLYRATLLRRRILLVTEAPVQTSCDYVYDLALLSSLPQSLQPLLPPQGNPALRPRPLFNIGVHDIPYLSSLTTPEPGSATPPNWIACTTDNVLALKPELYDVLVTLPPSYSKDAARKVYPKISIVHPAAEPQKAVKSTSLKATQRDARRFVILRDGLRWLPRNEVDPSTGNEDDSDAASTFSTLSIIEPLSWPRLAYTSFLWWASAGEKSTGLSEEEDEQDEQDTSLLASAAPPGQLSHPGLHVEESSQPQEIALIAYFRRLTTLIFTTLADAVARQDAVDGDDDDQIPAGYHDEPDADDDLPRSNDDDAVPLLPPQHRRTRKDRPDGERESPPVLITSSDMTEMGLDVWSATDRIFVGELLELWWGRTAHVDGTRIRCCGIPIL